jgi:predicted TPR repeat methyltransferase
MKKKRNKKKRRRPGTVNADAFRQAAAHERAGRLEAAENAYRKLLETAPEDGRVWFNLGNVLMRRDRPDRAAEAFGQAAEILKEMPVAHINHGNVLYLQGEPESALAAFRRALAIDADAVEAHMGMATVFRRLKRFDEAIDALGRAIEGAPDRIGLYGNLATLLQRQGRAPEAISLLRRAMARDPGNQTLRHRLDALSGKTTDAAPGRFVIETFDRMSATFDRHLVDDLGYRTPHALSRLVADHCRRGRPFEAMIDLGCGTGLSGQAFAVAARRISGIDMSPRMLEKAGEKGVYHRLTCGGIVDVLNRSDARYDLFVAADVFVYIGNLDPVFAAIRRRSRDGALVAFSTESCRGNTWVLHPTGRYAHGRTYIEDQARKHGFSILACRSERIRKEKNEWVKGDLFLLAHIPAPLERNRS